MIILWGAIGFIGVLLLVVVVPPPGKYWILLPCLTLVLGGFTLGMSMGAFKSFQQHRASQSWEEAQAVITRSERRQGERGAQDREPKYEFQVAYQFQVDGTPYTGNRYTLDLQRVDQSGVDDLVAKYPEGSQVTILYDPDNPGNSTIARGYGFSGWLFLLMALGTGFITVMIPWFGFRHLLKEQRKRRLSKTATASNSS